MRLRVMASLNVVTLTEENFENEVTKSPGPILVDFWAEWCGPCKLIAPLLDEIADEKAGKFKIAKVNVDHNQALSARFSIRFVPTLILFKDGQVKEQLVGPTSKSDLISKLDALV